MLPSKKIQVALVVLIVGIGALIFYSYKKNSVISYSSNNGYLAVASSTSNTINGLAQTDNNNSVTATNNTSPNTPQEKLTHTDVLARDFFTQLVKANQSGTQITADNADQFVSDYLKTAPLPVINQNQYSAKDLMIIDSNDANMRAYQTAITAVFTKNWPSGAKQNELIVLSDTFSNNDPKALDGLSTVISIYNNALQGSLKVSVPHQVVTEHLLVVNALSAYIQTLKMCQQAYTDTISGIVGLNALMQNRSNLTDSMAILRLYLINSIK